MSDDIFKFIPENFPPYAQQIMSQLEALDWFVHAFHLEHGDSVYNPQLYHYNAINHDTTYAVALDLNIYQFIVSAFKKGKKQTAHRDGIALVVFCMFSNILLDPTIAVNEKINFNSSLLEEAVDDLIIFRKLDNANMDALAEFALGNTDTLPLPDIQIDRDDLLKRVSNFPLRKRWETFKLYSLKIIELYYRNDLSVNQRAHAFFDWCHTDFVYSTAAAALAIYMFTGNEKTRVMKFKPDSSIIDKQRAVYNMAWDLNFPGKFFSNWSKNSQYLDYLYATHDRALKDIMRFAIKIQNHWDGHEHPENFEPVELELIINFIAGMDNDEDRGITKESTDFLEKKAAFITAIESKLLEST